MPRHKTLKKQKLELINLKSELSQKRELLKLDEIILSIKNFPMVRINTSQIKNNFLEHKDPSRDRDENSYSSVNYKYSSKNSIICANIINTIYDAVQNNLDYQPLNNYKLVEQLVLSQPKKISKLFGVILTDKSERNLIIAFRGALNSYEFKLGLEQYNPKQFESHYFVEGFLKIYLTFKKNIEQAIQKYPNISIWITGMSMGGAVASIFHYLLSKEGHTINGYTFGAPRALGPSCQYQLPEDKMHRFFRVINLNDPIPGAIPSATKKTIYQHSGYPIVYDYQGSQAIDNHAFYLTNMLKNSSVYKVA